MRALKYLLAPLLLEAAWFIAAMLTSYAPGETLVGNLPFIALPVGFSLLTAGMVLTVLLKKTPGKIFRWMFCLWIVGNILLSLRIAMDFTQDEQLLKAFDFMFFLRAAYFAVLLVLAIIWHRKLLTMERAAKKLTPTPQAQT